MTAGNINVRRCRFRPDEMMLNGYGWWNGGISSTELARTPESEMSGAPSTSFGRAFDQDITKANCGLQRGSLIYFNTFPTINHHINSLVAVASVPMADTSD